MGAAVFIEELKRDIVDDAPDAAELTSLDRDLIPELTAELNELSELLTPEEV